MDARGTVKFSKARPPVNGRSHIDIAIPSFDYQNHIAICRGFIRKSVVTHDARYDGSQLREVVTTNQATSEGRWIVAAPAKFSDKTGIAVAF